MASISMKSFFKSFNHSNTTNYFGKFETLSGNKLDPNLILDKKHIEEMEYMMFYNVDEDNHRYAFAKFPINVSSFLNILREYAKLNAYLDIPSMIFYSMHSIYDSRAKCFFYMITTDYGTIIIEKENETKFFIDTITEINNSDKVLGLERMEGNEGKYRCIQYGCYDFNSQTHFIIKPYTSQFHIFNKDFDNTYDFYLTRKYDDGKVITRSFADLYPSKVTALFCDKMGHVNITSSPVAQTMSLDGFSLGFSGGMKWSNENNDTIYFSIRGEVSINDIMHPDFLFKVTSITDNKEDIKFTILRNEINDTDTVISNVGYEDIEYTTLVNNTTNAMTIKHINKSSIPSRESIKLAVANNVGLICKNKGELDLVVGLDPDKRKCHYSIELLTDTDYTGIRDYREKYLIVDSRQFVSVTRNKTDKYTNYHFGFYDYPDIIAVETKSDAITIVGRTHPLKYLHNNNKIDYKLIAAYTNDSKVKFKLVFKSQKLLSNVNLKVNALDYYQSSNDKSIKTEVIPVIEPGKFYVVELEL